MPPIEIKLKISYPLKDGRERHPGDIILMDEDAAKKMVETGAAEYIEKLVKLEDIEHLEEKKETEKIVEEKKLINLNDYGLSVGWAKRGNALLLLRGEEALSEITSSKKLRKKLSNDYQFPLEFLEKAIAETKNKPKIEKKDNKKNKTENKDYKILTDPIIRIKPDAGIIENRSYVGIWLPCKILDQETNTTKIIQKFFLIFEDSEIIPCDKDTLAEKNIYLTCDPIYFPPKYPIEKAVKIGSIDLEPLDVANIYDNIINQFKKYIEFDDERLYDLHACWVIGTYFYRLFGAYPYLFINALKRCGKTKNLTMLNLLSYNSVFSTNMSTASLFRLVQNMGVSVMIDETEKLSNPERAEEFRNLLLSGYKRGGTAWRSEKGENEKQIPTQFEIYSPKALANIRGLEDVLEDRCISITLKRGINISIINTEIPWEDPIWEKIRFDLTRLWIEKWRSVLSIYEDFSVVSAENVVSVVSGGVKKEIKNIFGRDWELWKPILIIIYFISQSRSADTTLTTLNTQTTLIDNMISLAEEITNEKTQENISESGEYLLVQALLSLVKDKNYYRPVNMVNATSTLYDEGDMPKWITTRWIGHALKRLGFKNKRRVGRGVEYYLEPEKVKDVADRLGVKPWGETKEIDYNSCEDCGCSLTQNNLSLYKGKIRLCHDCAVKRLEKEKKEKLDGVVEGGPMQVEEVEVEQPKLIERSRDSLSELLKRTLDLFPLDRDEALRDEELFELMEKDMGLSRTESVKLIAILMREGTLFSPRPGFCKRVI
jgi:hypothetical protein